MHRLSGRGPCLGLDAGQGESSALPLSRPARGQALVGERLDPKSGQRRRFRFKREFVDAAAAGRFSAQNRAVGKHLQVRTIDHRGPGRLEDLPSILPGGQIGHYARFPQPLRIVQYRGLRVKNRLHCFDLGGPAAQFLLFPGEDVHFGGNLDRAVSRVVEDRVELVVLGLLERIVLVVVALGTSHGRTEPDRRGRVHSVFHSRVVELVVLRARLVVEHRVPMESSGDDLVYCRIRQQVPCELLDREAVEGQVAVESVNHPIAVSPNRARLVALVPVRVCIAR